MMMMLRTLADEARDMARAFGLPVAVVLCTGLWFYAFTSPPRAQADLGVDMARVETILTEHGFPAEGFAATPQPDLAFLDELAPDNCANVLRAAWLTRLAVRRQMPRFEREAGMIAFAVAAVVAQDDDKASCVEFGQ